MNALVASFYTGTNLYFHNRYRTPFHYRAGVCDGGRHVRQALSGSTP